jgi:hypothetical protein
LARRLRAYAADGSDCFPRTEIGYDFMHALLSGVLLIDESSKPRTDGIEAVAIEEGAGKGLGAQMGRNPVG